MNLEALSTAFARSISFLSIIMIGVGFIALLRQMKRNSRMRKSSHLISIFFSIVMLLFNVFVLSSVKVRWWYYFLLLFGAGFGFAWGTTTRLEIHKYKVFGKRSILYIFFWIASTLLTQVLAFFAKSNVVAFGLAGMFFSTGASLGSNGNTLYRMTNLQRNYDPALASQRIIQKTYCGQCGSALKMDARFCTKCGWKIT